MLRRIAGLAALMALLLTGGVASAQERARIVVANHALQFFAERVVGDAAQVVMPVPSEVDPSFWRPSIADISEIQSADLILLNGAGFSAWVDRVSLPRSKVVNTSAAIEDRFIVTESITHSHGDGDEHSHEGIASYTWLDLSLASAQAQAIAVAILRKQIAPENEVQNALEQLQSDLMALDAETAQALAPFAGMAVIATHPRYQYFGRRYGLSISALEWEAGASPSAMQLQGLAKLVEATGAKTLLWEAAPPPAAFEATAALGLSNVVFEPLAKEPTGQSFLQAFSTGVRMLAASIPNNEATQ